jgi:predicted DNA-binding protein with PD1-like motif
MKYTTASLGRALIVRLEDGDVVHVSWAAAGRPAGRARAGVGRRGGAGGGRRLGAGPSEGRATTIVPMERILPDVHEMLGVGTLFPDESGQPVLHLHAGFGRDNAASVGCIRNGIITWVVAEVVIIELTGSDAVRRRDLATGFDLLEI